MPKTKEVKSKDNEVIEKTTTKKIKDTDKKMVEKEEPNQLAAKAEEKARVTTKTLGKEVNEEIISEDAASLKVSSEAVNNGADEIAQAVLSTNDIESGGGKKT